MTDAPQKETEPLVPPEKPLIWNASGKGGAVAAGGHAAAVTAGIAMLETGGNAADAAVATILAESVTDYGMFAIGGEVPFIFHDAQRSETTVLSGLGAAPRAPEAIAWYMENGIPTGQEIKASPVPGAPGLCVTAMQRFGRLTFAQAAAPVLALLDAGDQEWHAAQAGMFRTLVETERSASGSREEKLQAVRDRFYRGDIADRLADYYEREGGFLRREDLAAHETRIETPVSIDYRGYTICKCGPWTQGPSLLQALRLLEGFDLKEMGHLSPDAIHVIVEALKLAFADRDAYYADPLFADVPLDALLSRPYAGMRRELIDLAAASATIRPGDPVNMKPLTAAGELAPKPGGTTTCVAADRWGNVVAATPSCNPPYSVCPETGVSHGRRLRCLNTNPDHPNCIAPGKRPCITLTPTLILRDGVAVGAVSVAGGDLQDQTTLNVLLNHIEFGMLPAEAVSRPRFSTSHHEGSFSPRADRRDAFLKPASLKINESVDGEMIEELKRRGHRVETTGEKIGSPVMLLRDPDSGMIHAAGDPLARRNVGAVED